jgi:hypothetical protein
MAPLLPVPGIFGLDRRASPPNIDQRLTLADLARRGAAVRLELTTQRAPPHLIAAIVVEIRTGSHEVGE